MTFFWKPASHLPAIPVDFSPLPQPHTGFGFTTLLKLPIRVSSPSCQAPAQLHPPHTYTTSRQAMSHTELLSPLTATRRVAPPCRHKCFLSYYIIGVWRRGRRVWEYLVSLQWGGPSTGKSSHMMLNAALLFLILSIDHIIFSLSSWSNLTYIWVSSKLVLMLSFLAKGKPFSVSCLWVEGCISILYLPFPGKLRLCSS